MPHELAPFQATHSKLSIPDPGSLQGYCITPISAYLSAAALTFRQLGWSKSGYGVCTMDRQFSWLCIQRRIDLAIVSDAACREASPLQKHSTAPPISIFLQVEDGDGHCSDGFVSNILSSKRVDQGDIIIQPWSF